MNAETINAFTGPTVAEQLAAIKWLEDAAVSACSESEQAIQAKNVLRIIKAVTFIKDIPAVRSAV